MPGWDGFDVLGFVRAQLGAAVFVDNDVNTVALGEHYMGFRDVDHLVFVKNATGIGSGIISSDGRVIVLGRPGLAGDLWPTCRRPYAVVTLPAELQIVRRRRRLWRRQRRSWSSTRKLAPRH